MIPITANILINAMKISKEAVNSNNDFLYLSFPDLQWLVFNILSLSLVIHSSEITISEVSNQNFNQIIFNNSNNSQGKTFQHLVEKIANRTIEKNMLEKFRTFTYRLVHNKLIIRNCFFKINWNLLFRIILIVAGYTLLITHQIPRTEYSGEQCLKKLCYEAVITDFENSTVELQCSAII